ncbi:glycerophosphodiester phosphodiesterase [Acidiferrimicrobium sp. IK]|uniref:glycerophosphodiester phosphodiesterase n=1 Tax=Acidiferrimicrobium sp. IK TaxID=2871700 RepID=UPI0021CB1F63|nr:glycerophosphodiester phosphodiesterase [Acidiferrimicrobium sp. IK]MCU4185374.1 glycerophosphodiester phosphodiesterase [Acidiferrimicrobium sp. IK]
MATPRLAAAESAVAASPLGASGGIQVWSHRGRVDSSSLFVDNTIDAVANALGSGVDGVETDTWLSADGVFVMTHDRDTPAGPVDRCTAGSLDQFDRLEEVLAAVGRAALNIELKVAPDSPQAEQARLGAALGSYLNTRSGQSGSGGPGMVVSSFSPVATREMLSVGLDARIGHLCVDVPPPRALADLAGRGYWGIHFLATADSVEKVAAIRAAGLAAVAWTVNDLQLAARLADAGVNVIITDTPVAVRGAVSRVS